MRSCQRDVLRSLADEAESNDLETFMCSMLKNCRRDAGRVGLSLAPCGAETAKIWTRSNKAKFQHVERYCGCAKTGGPHMAMLRQTSRCTSMVSEQGRVTSVRW